MRLGLVNRLTFFIFDFYNDSIFSYQLDVSYDYYIMKQSLRKQPYRPAVEISNA